MIETLTPSEPGPPNTTLHETLVGKRLQDVATPAAIVDQAIVRKNCKQMLSSVGALQVGFRPHVKTHKVITIILSSRSQPCVKRHWHCLWFVEASSSVVAPHISLHSCTDALSQLPQVQPSGRHMPTNTELD